MDSIEAHMAASWGLFFLTVVNCYKTVSIDERIDYIGKEMFEIDDLSFKSSKSKFL